jgi:hypothetical protein
MLTVLSLFATLSAVHAAEPVFVPEVTPGSTSEFALAFMLEERIAATLEAGGYRVLHSSGASSVVGPTDGCADAPGCPGDALEKLPLRMALVIKVERRDGQVYGSATVFVRGTEAAVDTRSVMIAPEREQEFADLAATLVQDAAVNLGEPDAAEVARAIALITSATPVSGSEGTVMAPKPPPPPAPEPTVVTAPLPSLPVAPPDSFESRLERARLSARHVAGVEKQFQRTTRPPLEWYRRNSPHAGRTIAEIRGGYGIGDVDRAADVSVDLENSGDQVSQWFQEGPREGQRLRGAVYIGYAPAAWIDVGVAAGVQYGVRGLTTGYTVNGVQTEDAGADEADAAQLYFDPMIRLYPVMLGPVKPYAMVQGDFRLFDDYAIIDPDDADFPEPPGGAVLGVGGGGGLLIDPGPVVGFFVEGSYVKHTGIRSKAAFQGEPPNDPPPAPAAVGYTIGLVGGVQFRI